MKRGYLLLFSMLALLTSARYVGDFNHRHAMVTGANIAINFGGPNCIRTTGLCFNNYTQQNGFAPPLPGYKATAFVNANGRIVFDILMSDLPSDVFWEQFKDDKFYQTAACPFDSKLLSVLGLQDTTQIIASGEYPVSIVNSHVQIIF